MNNESCRACHCRNDEQQSVAEPAITEARQQPDGDAFGKFAGAGSSGIECDED